MQANREGRFRARVLDSGVNETGPNKLSTVILRFGLIEEFLDGEWKNIEGEGLDIVAYCYLEKRDGTLNDFQITMLKNSFDWDGLEPWTYFETPGLPVAQVTIKEEEYEGKRRMRVQYINSYGSEPTSTVTKADEETRRSMTARLGSKLRAFSGSTAPKKSAPAKKAPAAPKAPAPATPTPAAPPTKPLDIDAVWTRMVAFGETRKRTEAEIEAEWFEKIKAVCGHDEANKVTPEQWIAIAAAIPECPF